MRTITPSQYRRALLALAGAHIAIIAASNYLVQLPIELLGVHTTWGAFSFPFIFLATDLTVRTFGQAAARRIILVAMGPALIVSYVFGVLFQQGAFQGLESLAAANAFVGRIAAASFLAYVLGQLLDIHVFERLRRAARWWVAPAVSTVFGNAADTLAFFGLAFHRSPDPFMAANWPEIALVDYASKIAISLLLFVPAYGLLLTWLQRRVLGADGRVVLKDQPA
ncbi:7-cyano-7-deazaguanine/7-aminomethyl-7-deazaguanine transporter [Spiribacter halobius]|uniref:Probable queuosine precursor transporter n=1 Tax=Sediminicurvatus halobius TaxID=2182432 RepID=A0A2U2MZK3_9GAMM|nr:7-cyano-7-deazaguanine/7-aminomethyl-7-deazaguanine transporter [Spiribacter halobius]PWG62415.1 7-cyano-7-deazaguanine/7-aminomethyl-7-deazaguanine transporter [Spiribacter halobius]UEX79517.1 7-cyano-7-deazaguanine/7-aminomethyl-7-deazaguanine transporter [Spiribacter halobius]